MSRQAIAAVLPRDDLGSGERLVALSLASFADRENRAWPGAPVAAARAGLRRSRYLKARERLIARGLVLVDKRATGRGRSSTVSLAFANAGPWWDGELNVELCETVLSYSAARGPARLLLATMAAVAEPDGAVRGLSTEQLCAAAGIADRTYRRARMALLQSGELVLVTGVGGRGNTNVWLVPDPRFDERIEARRAPRRVAPPANARPLAATVVGRPDAGMSVSGPDSVASVEDGQDRTIVLKRCPVRTGVSTVKGGHDRTVLAQNRPGLTGVSASKGGQDRTVAGGKRPAMTGVSVAKGGQDRAVYDMKGPIVTGVLPAKPGQDQTLFELPTLKTPAQTAAETPAETPPPNARAGGEPRNPRIREDPPGPPEGGYAESGALPPLCRSAGYAEAVSWGVALRWSAAIRWSSSSA